MPRKKKIAIPEVDIIKSGVNNKTSGRDKTREAGLVNDDNCIILKRNDKIIEMSKKSAVKAIQEKEEELKKMKKDIEKTLDVDKDEVEAISKKIKKEKKSDKKKKKKKDGKNKDKKKKKKESYADSLLESVPSDLAEFIREGGNKGAKKKKKKAKKKAAKKQKEREELGIKVKERKKRTENKEKDKKEKSEVAERFKEVEKITRENIKEIDNTMAIVDKRIKELTSSSERVRGKDTALANYFAAKTSLISTKQKAATDILSSRAKVYDIEMKKARDASSASSSDADILSRLFPGISMNSKTDESLKDYVSKNGKNKDKKKRKKEKDFDADALMKREKELRKKGQIEFSPWEENIEWEGKYNVAIKKSWTNDEWKFIAVDDDGNVLRDVPKEMLPSKKAVQMAFDDEKDVAIDKNTNTMYKVLQVPAI